jgi:hypothetical protein
VEHRKIAACRTLHTPEVEVEGAGKHCIAHHTVAVAEVEEDMVMRRYWAEVAHWASRGSQASQGWRMGLPQVQKEVEAQAAGYMWPA